MSAAGLAGLVVAADQFRDHAELARGSPGLQRREPAQQPGELVGGRVGAAALGPGDLVSGQRKQTRRDQRVPPVRIRGEPGQPGIMRRRRTAGQAGVGVWVSARPAASARLPPHHASRRFPCSIKIIK